MVAVQSALTGDLNANTCCADSVPHQTMAAAFASVREGDTTGNAPWYDNQYMQPATKAHFSQTQLHRMQQLRIWDLHRFQDEQDNARKEKEHQIRTPPGSPQHDVSADRRAAPAGDGQEDTAAVVNTLAHLRSVDYNEPALPVEYIGPSDVDEFGRRRDWRMEHEQRGSPGSRRSRDRDYDERDWDRAPREYRGGERKSRHRDYDDDEYDRYEERSRSRHHHRDRGYVKGEDGEVASPRRRSHTRSRSPSVSGRSRRHHRSASRSRSRSPAPRHRHRSRSRSPAPSRRHDRDGSASPRRGRARSLSQSRSPSPPPRAHSPSAEEIVKSAAQNQSHQEEQDAEEERQRKLMEQLKAVEEAIARRKQQRGTEQ
eukprot:m.362064 g.362064  ORF g.362064 m.362064 type:complete len:371 (+) comp20076_c0_seq1:106-1218(+)